MDFEFQARTGHGELLSTEVGAGEPLTWDENRAITPAQC